MQRGVEAEFIQSFVAPGQTEQRILVTQFLRNEQEPTTRDPLGVKIASHFITLSRDEAELLTIKLVQLLAQPVDRVIGAVVQLPATWTPQTHLPTPEITVVDGSVVVETPDKPGGWDG